MVQKWSNLLLWCPPSQIFQPGSTTAWYTSNAFAYRIEVKVGICYYIVIGINRYSLDCFLDKEAV